MFPFQSLHSLISLRVLLPLLPNLPLDMSVCSLLVTYTLSLTRPQDAFGSVAAYTTWASHLLEGGSWRPPLRLHAHKLGKGMTACKRRCGALEMVAAGVPICYSARWQTQWSKMASRPLPFVVTVCSTAQLLIIITLTQTPREA